MMRNRSTALLAAATILASSGSADASPRSIRKMDSTAIQAVPDQKLCKAYAHYAGVRKSYPSLDAEVQRRGLSCSEELEYTVSDCRPLRIVGSEAVAPGAIAYAVQNQSSRRKAFRIYAGGVVSSRFTIGPKEQRGYGVATDPRIAQLAGTGAQLSGEGAGAELTECLTSDW